MGPFDRLAELLAYHVWRTNSGHATVQNEGDWAMTEQNAIRLFCEITGIQEADVVYKQFGSAWAFDWVCFGKFAVSRMIHDPTRWIPQFMANALCEGSEQFYQNIDEFPRSFHEAMIEGYAFIKKALMIEKFMDYEDELCADRIDWD